MANTPENHPFAIQLEVEFLDRLSEPVREGRAKSVSDIIRRALERFDLENVVVVRPAQLSISVRLPTALREDLLRVSRAKHASVGQLVRSAVEAYLPQMEPERSGQLEIPIPHIEMAKGTDSAPEPALASSASRKRKQARLRKAAKRSTTKPMSGKSRPSPKRTKRSTRKKR
jgi:Arc/MetJ-type ribon-helix-helix transcriptional regulator